MNFASPLIRSLIKPLVNATSAGGVPRVVQPHRAYKFDGTNDCIDYGGLLTTGNFSVSFWVYIPLLNASCGFVGQGDTFDTGTGFACYTNSSGTVYAMLVRGGTRVFGNRTGVTQATWCHVAVTVNRSGNMVIYVNGVASTGVSVTGVTGSIANGSFFAGRYGNSSTYLPGRMFDLQVFGEALTSGQVTELKDYGPYALTGTARILWDKMDSQNTIISYDSSGNSRNGTLTLVTATVGQFFYEGGDVPHSYQNTVGYTYDETLTYIPRDESDTDYDVLGNPLQFSGPV